VGTTHWSQYSHAEIMSLHGLEVEEVETDLYQDEDGTDSYQKGCNCLNCMDCLGLSWKDFM